MNSFQLLRTKFHDLINYYNGLTAWTGIGFPGTLGQKLKAAEFLPSIEMNLLVELLMCMIRETNTLHCMSHPSLSDFWKFKAFLSCELLFKSNAGLFTPQNCKFIIEHDQPENVHLILSTLSYAKVLTNEAFINETFVKVMKRIHSPAFIEIINKLHYWKILNLESCNSLLERDELQDLLTAIKSPSRRGLSAFDFEKLANHSSLNEAVTVLQALDQHASSNNENFNCIIECGAELKRAFLDDSMPYVNSVAQILSLMSTSGTRGALVLNISNLVNNNTLTSFIKALKYLRQYELLTENNFLYLIYGTEIPLYTAKLFQVLDNVHILTPESVGHIHRCLQTWEIKRIDSLNDLNVESVLASIFKLLMDKEMLQYQMLALELRFKGYGEKRTLEGLTLLQQALLQLSEADQLSNAQADYFSDVLTHPCPVEFCDIGLLLVQHKIKIETKEQYEVIKTHNNINELNIALKTLAQKNKLTQAHWVQILEHSYPEFMACLICELARFDLLTPQNISCIELCLRTWEIKPLALNKTNERVEEQLIKTLQILTQTKKIAIAHDGKLNEWVTDKSRQNVFKRLQRVNKVLQSLNNEQMLTDVACDVVMRHKEPEMAVKMLLQLSKKGVFTPVIFANFDHFLNKCLGSPLIREEIEELLVCFYQHLKIEQLPEGFFAVFEQRFAGSTPAEIKRYLPQLTLAVHALYSLNLPPNHNYLLDLMKSKEPVAFVELIDLLNKTNLLIPDVYELIKRGKNVKALLNGINILEKERQLTRANIICIEQHPYPDYAAFLLLFLNEFELSPVITFEFFEHALKGIRIERLTPFSRENLKVEFELLKTIWLLDNHQFSFDDLNLKKRCMGYSREKIFSTLQQINQALYFLINLNQLNHQNIHTLFEFNNPIYAAHLLHIFKSEVFTLKHLMRMAFCIQKWGIDRSDVFFAKPDLDVHRELRLELTLAEIWQIILRSSLFTPEDVQTIDEQLHSFWKMNTPYTLRGLIQLHKAFQSLDDKGLLTPDNVKNVMMYEDVLLYSLPGNDIWGSIRSQEFIQSNWNEIIAICKHGQEGYTEKQQLVMDYVNRCVLVESAGFHAIVQPSIDEYITDSIQSEQLSLTIDLEPEDEPVFANIERITPRTAFPLPQAYSPHFFITQSPSEHSLEQHVSQNMINEEVDAGEFYEGLFE